MYIGSMTFRGLLKQGYFVENILVYAYIAGAVALVLPALVNVRIHHIRVRALRKSLYICVQFKFRIT
jgi:hypothetical protein